MAQSNGDVLAKDFENIILAWSSGISGEQREVLAPEAKELVQMLCSSAERVRKQHELELLDRLIAQEWSFGEDADAKAVPTRYLKAERERLGK